MPVVSVPRATLLAAMVMVALALARFVMLALPETSPKKVRVKSATSKSKVLSVSSYVTDIPFSVLLVTMAPTVSAIASESLLSMSSARD